MEPSIFKFILRHSMRQQITILCLTVGSFPFLYLSLDLPKIIINDAINARDFPKELPLGLFGEFEQIPYLLLLSGVFLVLVIIKSGFKFRINIYQGLLGERMLRRLRYELYSRILLFPLPYFRRVSPNEMIPMITAEVEPLGGFIGEAIALPAFYGGTLVVIFAFVFIQDPILGLAAIALYPIQGYLIPRLQRRVNELAKQRVRAVRETARNIGETVAGVTEIHAHDTSQYELAKFAGRLGRIYEIRYEIYRRKFFIKFLNGFLAQLTPFFFYSIGGYLVIEGDLSFGSLVAVLAAYKDLTPPWKELLKYYQRQADARIKYEQVTIQFQPADMMDEALQTTDPEPDEPLKGDIVATNVKLEEDDQVKVIDGVNFTFGLDEHIAIVGSGASGKETLAMLIARLIAPTGGRLTIGGRGLSDLPASVTGRRMAYVGPSSYMFSGSVRDNLLYGLKHRPLRPADYDEATAEKRARALQDAVLTGNTGLDPRAGWTDYAAAGADGHESLRVVAMGFLDLVEMDDTLYEMGLRGTLDPGKRPKIAAQLLSAREAIRGRLKAPDMAGLVEPFDEAKYNDNATVAENLLFGTPLGAGFDIDNLAESPYVRKVLDQVGLTSDLLEMGRQVAGLMIELFSGLDPGHEFFDQYSFIEAEDLPEFHALLGRITKEGLEALGVEDRNRLLSLPFKLIPARHRLDQIDDDMRDRLLAARRTFAAELPEALKSSVEFFDAEKYNAAASLQDNILFGKVAYGQALSAERVGGMIAQVVDELGLRDEVMEVGLDYEVGIGGTRLGIGQRQRLAIVRSLLKRPDLMIVNEALTALDDALQTRILRNLIAEMKGRGLIFVSPRAGLAREFGRVVVMESGRIAEQGTFTELDREGTRLHELMRAG